MKKVRILIIFIFIILIAFSCFRFLSKGYTITYKLGINNEYEIKEIYTKKEANETDNYYLEINIDKVTYSYQLFDSFSIGRKIVTEIIYYNGKYNCLLPIIDGKVYTDILCYKDNRFYNYAHLIGKDTALDTFVNNIDINIYDKDDWLDKSTETTTSNGIIVHDYNNIKDHYIGITNLKGIYTLENKVNNKKIFSKDVYNRELSAIVGNYYITADYNEKTQFRTFYFVDLINGKIKEEKASNYISFDSYIQGIVNNELYIYDRDNEKQYKITIDKPSITEIGNSKKKIQYYNNGEWDKITIKKANKSLLFDYNVDIAEFEKFDYAYLDGGKKSGYYYLFEKKTGYYNVYRTHVQNKNSITYLFQVEKISDIYYVGKYIYYRDKSKIKYYSDNTGIRTLLEYSELEFNENLIFGVYEKK